MNWLRALLNRGAVLEDGQRRRLERYRALPVPDLAVPFSELSVLVVDVEAAGLDPRADSLISIGAVRIDAGVIRLDSVFEVLLRQERPSSGENILVHRIGGTAQLQGRNSADGLLDFLAAAGTAPLVAFHADFDRVLIEQATSAALGVKPVNAWLDLALIAPAVLRSQPRPLDAWLERFGIENHDRHDAVADAFATAKLLLVVLASARAQGIDTWAGLAAAQRDQRWLERAGNTV